MPKVTVIIPTHNRAPLLHRSISSVLSQDYSDFELIVVDDSPDKEGEGVASSFGDPRVHYIGVKPMTASAARNFGIGQASGDYVAFLDDDDEWLPAKLSKQISVFDRSRLEGGNVALVYTGVNYINETKGFSRAIMPTYRGNVLDRLLEAGFVRTLSAVMIQADVLREAGGFDVTMPSLHDWDLYLRIARRYQFDFVPEVLVNYHVNYSGIMHDVEKQLAGLGIFYRKYREQMKPRALSNYYLFTGVALYYHDEPGEGRWHLVKSITVYWKNYKAIPVIGLSMLGGKVFKRVYRISQETVLANIVIKISDR